MPLSPEEFIKRLEAISESGGIPYGRTHLLFRKEREYQKATLQYKGHRAISDAFKCFFLETVELIGTDCMPKITGPLSEFYSSLVPRMAHSFQSLCGAERVAICGYPLHGYTLLRNTFDNNVLTSASLQKFTDFYSVEGVERGKPLDTEGMKKLRKITEYAVRRKMTGDQSDLSQETIKELKIWDMLFDWEIHGARLSLTGAQEWVRGVEPLPVLPRFNEMQFGMFMNRYSEVAWTTHRLIPALQPTSISLSDAWKAKWRVLDESFEQMVMALTKENKKAIGAAIVELVKTKFPFNEHSTFPL